MASGGCNDAFVALVECVAAAVKDGSGTPTTTTQPLPCLDAADSLKKCMEENAGEYAHTLDLIAPGAGALYNTHTQRVEAHPWLCRCWSL